MAPAAEEEVFRDQNNNEQKHEEEERRKEKALLLRVENDQSEGFDWYKLELVENSVLEKFEWPVLREEQERVGSLTVTLGAVVYIIGGSFRPARSFCEEVYYLDTLHPEAGWREAPPVKCGFTFPPVVTFNGQLYVFNLDDPRVFNPILNKWDALPVLTIPNGEDVGRASFPVLTDFSKGLFLVHSYHTESLYAYSMDDGTWTCLVPKFGKWRDLSVAVDGVLYCYCAVDRCILAYDLIEHKWLSVVCPTKFGCDIAPPEWDALLHLGNSFLCLCIYSPLLFGMPTAVEFAKFKVKKTSGGDIIISRISYHFHKIEGGGRVRNFLPI